MMACPFAEHISTSSKLEAGILVNGRNPRKEIGGARRKERIGIDERSEAETRPRKRRDLLLRSHDPSIP